VSRLNDDQIISLVSQNMTNVFLYNDHPSARVQEAVYNLLPHWYKFDRFHYHHLGRVANTKIRQKIIHNYPSLVKFLWEPSDRELVQTVLLHPESSVDLILTDSGDVNYKLLALANILLSGADRILAKKYLPGESHKKINHAMKLWAPYWNKILGGKT
jgi:hypothetical protein